MKRILLAGATLLALTAAQPTLAADAPIYRKGPAPMTIAAYNWSGLYIGIQGGYAWGRSLHDLTGAATDTGPFDVRGGLIGGTLGWNWQAPGSPIVFGVEGDWSWVWKKGSAPNPVTPNFISETHERWLATLRGRLGIAFDRSLVFITGGWAAASVEARATNTTVPVTISETKTRNGWTLGGGFETAFASNWTAKFEYLYVQLQGASYFTPPPVGGFTARDNVSLNNHIVRIGLNYRF